MDTRDTRAAGWQTFSGLVLALSGIFGVVYGLMAVYRSTFFAGNAVFVFSDLNTWGWITFGLGVLAIASGLAVFSGREWARWTGITVASLGALGQLMIRAGVSALVAHDHGRVPARRVRPGGLRRPGQRRRARSAYRSETTTTEIYAASVGYLRCERPGAPGGVAAPGVTGTRSPEIPGPPWRPLGTREAADPFPLPSR